MSLTTASMSNRSRISLRGSLAGGQPISHLMQKALAHPEIVSLAAGFVDRDSLPVESTIEAFQSLWSNPDKARAALQYGTTAGYMPLREAIFDELLASDRTAAAVSSVSGLSAEQVVLTAGSNQMLHLVTDTLCDPGDIVLCSAPAYFVYLGVLKNMGIRSYGVTADEYGIVPESLDEALTQLDKAGELPRVKAIYVVSYYDNPRGVNLAIERRQAIVELARKWSRCGKLYVLEDAAYRELRYAGADLPSLHAYDSDPAQVIYTSTFSKSYSPGVRIGWGVLPAELVSPVCEQKGNLDFGSPNLNQYLMAEIIQLGLYRQQADRVRAAYSAKLSAMLAALDIHLGTVDGVEWLQPEGGLYVWLQTPPGIDTGLSGPLFDLAVSEGVLYVPGEYFYPTEGAAVAKNQIRLSFGVQNAERIAEGIAALARAIKQLL